MKKKNPLRFLIWFFILLVIIFAGAVFYFNQLKSPVNANGEMKAFVVQRGESASEVADRLESEGLIKSSLVFKFLIRDRNVTIDAGDFKISPAMSTEEIIKTLSEGPIDRWVTIIEGWRVEQIADKLNKDLGVEREAFLKVAKEGYMFPDTYLFNPDANVVDIASIMRNNFDKKYTEELQSKIRAKGLTPEQGVILASLIEREARSDKVRTEVAGVLLKRFKMGMKLDIDATVQYAKDTQTLSKTGKLDKYWQPITRAEYSSVVSPYNTYLNNGLPPTPIANPSLSALNAVANANPNTPYIFYCHDNQGNTYYSQDIDEHNEKCL